MIMWQYCKDPNDINRAIAEKDENWEGITEESIINITWDSNHGCYVVFWRTEKSDYDVNALCEEIAKYRQVAPEWVLREIILAVKMGGKKA